MEPPTVFAAYAVEPGGGCGDNSRPPVLPAGLGLNPMREDGAAAADAAAGAPLVTVLGEPIVDIVGADGSVCMSAQNQQLCIYATCVWLICFTFGFLLFAFRGVL